MTKPKVGFFSLTCCEGCQIEILDLEDVILDIADMIDIQSFRLAKAQNIEANFDISFLEGSVSSKEDAERTKLIRERSKVLVALGTCACTGGVQAMKNHMGKGIEKAQFGNKKLSIPLQDAAPISSVVDVDHFIRGCPLDKGEFTDILKKFLLEVNPYQREWPVCTECRSKENPCLLEAGKICLGPLTYSGCDAVCPSNGLYCVGCRGIMNDANVKSFVEELKKKHKLPDIKRAFTTMYGTSQRIKEVK